MRAFRPWWALLLAVVVLAPFVNTTVAVADPMQSDGPHASPQRKPAMLQDTSSGGVRTLRFDLGNLDLTNRPGQFVTPLRGSLVLPTRQALRKHGGKAPLVFIGHLRSFGCSGDVFAYPCPAGQTELRLDRGMEYLAAGLARQGYATVVPDLSPTLLAATATSDYPMGAAFVKVNTVLRDKVLAGDPRLGPGVKESVKAGPASLVTHSRSGLFAGDLASAWAKSPTPLQRVLAVAPAYDIGGPWTPAPPDVPYLGLYGDRDDDVPLMANNYLAHHLGAARTTPAMTVQLPGYGHMFFNSALGQDDDRKACDSGCRSLCQHQSLLTRAAVSWLQATRPGGPNPDRLPLAASDMLPTRLWGETATVLAATPAASSSLLAGTPAERSAVTVRGGKTSICRVVDPSNPSPPSDACPEPESATIMTKDVPLRRVQLGTRGRVTYRITSSAALVSTVAVHVSPFDNQAGGNPLRIVAADGAGHRCTVDVPGSQPALANRAAAGDNGSYVVGTVRVSLGQCAGLDRARLASVTLSAPSGKGDLLLRGVDVSSSAAKAQKPTAAAPKSADSPTAPWVAGVAALLLLGAVVLLLSRRRRG